MAGTLRGVDVLALTGGIGEPDNALQSELREALAWWGAEVETLIVPADEEGMIARLCRRHSTTPASAPVG